MNLLKRYVLIFSVIFATFCLPVLAAQDEGEEPGASKKPVKVEYKTLGDQSLTINAGLMIPLFFNVLSDSTIGVSGRTSTNLSLGGVGSLGWMAYLNNNWNIGIELAGMFTYSPNDNTFYMIPLMFKGGYDIYLLPR